MSMPVNWDGCDRPSCNRRVRLPPPHPTSRTRRFERSSEVERIALIREAWLASCWNKTSGFLSRSFRRRPLSLYHLSYHASVSAWFVLRSEEHTSELQS